MRDGIGNITQDLTKSISTEEASKKRKWKRPLERDTHPLDIQSNHAFEIHKSCHFWGEVNIHKLNVNSIFAICFRPWDYFQLDVKMSAASFLVGIVMMVLGVLSAIIGTIMCYRTKVIVTICTFKVRLHENMKAAEETAC